MSYYLSRGPLVRPAIIHQSSFDLAIAETDHGEYGYSSESNKCSRSASSQRHLSAQYERLSCVLHSISTPLAAVMAATRGFPGEGTIIDIKDVVRPIHNTPNPKSIPNPQYALLIVTNGTIPLP